MKVFRVGLILLALIIVIVTIFDVRDMIVNEDHRLASGYLVFGLFVLMMVYRALEKKTGKAKDQR